MVRRLDRERREGGPISETEVKRSERSVQIMEGASETKQIWVTCVSGRADGGRDDGKEQ